MLTETRRFSALFLAIAAPLVAQDRPVCATQGPGDAFGVAAYGCASCQIRYDKGQAPAFDFYSELTVNQIVASTPLKVGDVIEAINGQPITTAAASNQFTHPAPGMNTLTVRRGRDHTTLNFNIPAAPVACADSLKFRFNGAVGYNRNYRDSLRFPFDNYRGSTLRYSAFDDSVMAKLGFFRATSDSARLHIRATREEISSPQNFEPARRFGFAIACASDCTNERAADGTLVYVKYKSPPRIIAIQSIGVAAKVGLELGDLVVKIDGIPITDTEASLRLARAQQRESLKVTVRRNGKEIEFLLQAVKP